MPEVIKTLEDRAADLESIYIDMPELLNARFERVNLHLNELSSRLDLLDRQMGALTRDLRGGVTRQLVEQDKRLGDLDRRLAAIEERLGTLDARAASLDSGQVVLKSAVSDVQAGLQVLGGKLDEILMRLPR